MERIKQDVIADKAQDYVSRLYAEDEYPIGIRDIENDVEEAFKDGANWRINSVWHSTKELPEHSGYLAVLIDNGFIETTYYTAGNWFDDIRLKSYDLWAYVSDLLPDRKEEQP